MASNVNIPLSVVPAAPVQTTITGTVTDANGLPLPGTSVLVDGTNTGAQTDFDGNFTIDAAADATLIFSYVGFPPKQLP